MIKLSCEGARNKDWRMKFPSLVQIVDYDHVGNPKYQPMDWICNHWGYTYILTFAVTPSICSKTWPTN